jgi:hypothetical protein
MKPIVFYAALSTALLTPAFCCADEIPAKLSETSFYVETSDGIPNMCGIEFRILYADQFNRQGALSHIAGSLVWRADNGRILFLEKLLGADVQAKQSIRFPISSAFFSYDGDSTQAWPLPGGCTDDIAGFCGAYVDAPAIGALAAIYESKFLVSFRRKDSLADTVIRLDLTSAVQDAQRKRSFDKCTDIVIDPIVRSLSQARPNH